MAAALNVLTTDVDPGTFPVDDPRIPDHVRDRFADYDKNVSTVVPVIGLAREEWWLFDTEDALVDVLCRRQSFE